MGFLFIEDGVLVFYIHVRVKVVTKTSMNQ